MYASKSVSERSAHHADEANHRPHTRPKAPSHHDENPVSKAPAAKKQRALKPPEYRNAHIKMPPGIQNVKDLKKSILARKRNFSRGGKG